MQWKRTATIVVGAGACAAWLAAAATSGRRDIGPRQLVAPAPSDTHAVLAGEIARLHGHLTPAVTPREPGRNPFVFVTPRPKPMPVTPKAALAETPAVAVPPPPFTLAGIAEDASEKGPQRTAIISAAGQLFLVKEGEAVTTRYRVTRITADVVEISDIVTNATLRLALR